MFVVRILEAARPVSAVGSAATVFAEGAKATMQNRRASSVAVGIVLSVATSAAAQATDPWFVWIAPAECPSGEAVLTRIRATAQDGAPKDLTARAVVESIGGRWSGRVEVTGGESHWERTFEGDSCAAVADAVALTVSLSIARSSAVSGETATSAQPATAFVAPWPLPAPASKTRAAATPVRELIPGPEANAPTSHSRPHGSFSVNAEGVVDVGGVPSPSPGAGVGVAWRAKPLEIGIEAIAVEGQRGTVPGSASGATVSLTAASASVCLVVPIGDRIVACPCAGGAVERLAAHGFGPSDTFVATQPVAVLPAAVGEARLEWSPMWAVALRASARALAPLSRPTFVVRGPAGGTADRPSSVDVEPSLGVVVRFGK